MSPITIRPLQPDQVESVCKAANEDAHAIIPPGLVISKGDIVIGHVAILPAAFVWLHTQKAKARDSLEVLHFLENHLGAQGHGIIALPVVPRSPLRSFIPRAGYLDAGAQVYLKNLNT